MTRFAFKETNLYEVSEREYRPPRSYEYRTIKRTGTVCVAPIIQLRVWNIENYRSREAYLLVDTGADVSALTESTAKSLELDCQPRQGEPPVLLIGAGGNPIVGLLRWIIIHLGGVPQKVPVVVPMPLEDLQEREEGSAPLLSSPQLDILGRAGIFENYLLCFDSRRLYAFRRRGSHNPGLKT